MSGAGAAFFDLDRTLMAGSSAFAFGRAAHRAGMITRRQIARDAYAHLRFRVRGSTDSETHELRDRIGQMLAGVRQRDLQRLGSGVLIELLPRVYPRMLAVAYEHQDAGRPAFIVTAAGNEIAEVLAHVLAFDGGIGSRSEIRDGVYTGKPDGPFMYREGKAEALRQVAAERGFDLSESWAYSDSESDLPMLRAVGHPVAVNPDAALERIAREEGWEILRFETLGRRIKIAAGAAGAALVGGLGSAAVARARRR